MASEQDRVSLSATPNGVQFVAMSAEGVPHFMYMAWDDVWRMVLDNGAKAEGAIAALVDEAQNAADSQPSGFSLNCTCGTNKDTCPIHASLLP